MKSSATHTSSEQQTKEWVLFFLMCISSIFKHLRLESPFRLAVCKSLGAEAVLQT